MRIEELTMILLNNDNCLSVQRWAGASTIEKMKFVSSNILEPTLPEHDHIRSSKFVFPMVAVENAS